MLRERIDGAIERVFEMQDSSGAFGIWGPSDGDMWLTSYVTDFLTRAKEAGYAGAPAALQPGARPAAELHQLRAGLRAGGEGRAYALYVLARNGRAPIGELRYYVDTKLDNFSTPLAQAQLGAALAMMGDKPRAEKALQAALKAIGEKDDGITRRDYGTGIRDGAALITLASETGLAKAEVPRLVDVVAKAYRRQVLHLDAGAGLDAAGGPRARRGGRSNATLTVNGAAHKGQLDRSVSPAELKDGALVIGNDGDAPVDAVVSVIGAALTPEPAVSKGFTIERTYYTLDGKKIDLKSATGGDSRAQAERPTGGGAEGGRRRRRAAASCWSTACRPASRSRTRGWSTPATSRRWAGSRPR